MKNDLFLPERLATFMKESGLFFHESGGSYVMDCPVCQKKGKLYIRKRDGEVRCWHCYRQTNDPGGKPEFALSLLMGQSLGSIQSRLYNWRPDASTEGRIAIRTLFNDPDDEEILTSAPLPETEMPPGCHPLDDAFFSHRGRAYLEGRGVPLEVAMEYGIQYWTTQRKVVFPVIIDGRLAGWQWRTIDKVEPFEVERYGVKKIVKPLKSLTWEGMPRDRVLMFHDRLIGSPHAVLSEGPVDGLKAHLCGGNVVTMGKVIGDGQLDLIRAAGCKRVYLALDPDATEDTAQLIRTRGLEELYWMEVPKGYKDQGEMPMEEVLDVFHAAKRAFSTNVFVSLAPAKVFG
jgi:hypothetical protein